MKHVFYILISLIFAHSISSTVAEEKDPPQGNKTTFRIATYNIRYQAPDDIETGNSWEQRKKPLAELMLNHAFDIIATQEGDAKQIQDLQELLPDFDQVGHPYGGKTHDLHTCATFYRKSLFDVMGHGVFWLSQTPNEPSIGWDASDRRICFWTKFRSKNTGKDFFVFNVHFYWRKNIAKEKSAPLLINKIKEIAKEAPAIALGDYNSLPDSPQIYYIKSFMSDARGKSQTPSQGGIHTAFPGGIFTGTPQWCLDYIFVSPIITVRDFKVLADTYADGRYASDHLPVASEVSF